MEYTVLVKYEQWIDSGHPQIDDTVKVRTKIVKVKDLLELNDLFRKITDVEILNCTQLVYTHNF